MSNAPARNSTFAEAVVGLIGSQHFVHGTEAQLQEAVANLLRAHGYECEREVSLDTLNRVDILCEGVGIEVKIESSRSDVARQLMRYAQFPRIEALVLVTTRSIHRSLMGSIGSKPIFVAYIGGGL